MDGNVRILTIGDPHIRTSEVEFTDLMLKEIVDIATREQPDAIVVLGDTLHTNNNIDANPLSRAVRWLRKLQDIAPLILLIGNHDIKHKEHRIDLQEEPEHPFVALRWWNNTTVVDKPTLFKVRDHTFLAAPYVPDGQYHECISSYLTTEVTAYFSHNAFYGVRYKLNQPPDECGDVWPTTRKLMICGHIHTYQWVSENLVFVGTPGQQDHGEPQDKGVMIFTFSETSFSHTRIRLVTIPIRRELILSFQQTRELQALLAEVKDMNEQAILHLTKVTLSGAASQLRVLQKSTLYRELKEQRGVSLNPTPTDDQVEDAVQETLRRTIDKSSDIPVDDQPFLRSVEGYFRDDPAILELLKEVNV